MSGTIEFALLGTLEVRGGDGPLRLGRPKQRALLALLLLHPNRVMARERLIDELWGESPPGAAAKAIQMYVSQLRKVLPATMLVTRAPGYALDVDPEAIDLCRFERLVAEARTSEPTRASVLLSEALGLWRGPALAEFGDEPFALAEAGRLAELRQEALEGRIDADLALGRHAELVGQLDALVAAHPQRERLRGQMMLALYRSGRQAEALDLYREARTALGKLGLEPGTALRELERRILTHDAALEPPREGPLVAPRGGRMPLPGPLVPAPAFPFVGRAGELAALRALLERAEGGEGAVALLAAEAGGGKTRLVRELAHEAAARRALVLYGVSDATVTIPYQPVREWLEFLLRVCDQDVLAEQVTAGAALLAPLAPGLARPGGEPDDRTLPDAAVELLHRLAELQPLVLVAEDLHWADAETLRLLDRLARAAPESRLLVIATYRDRGEEIGAALADTLAGLARLDGVTRLSLGRFGDDDVRAFVRAAADAEPSADLAAAIGDLTGGTPLLLCELWRDLTETGSVALSEAHLELLQPPAELHGPERLRDVVRQRLARLTPTAAAVAELAAVTGPRFELPVLAAAARLGPQELADALGELTRNGLVEDLPGAAPTYRFTHELVRRAVYDRIASVDRAALHLRVGEALERAHAAELDAVLPELAHHFTIAAPIGGVERAVDYNLRAGAGAIAAAAIEEASVKLESALELGIADPRERARTQVELAHLLYELGRASEAEAMLAASLDAATGLDERGIAARALVDRIANRSGDPRLGGEEMRKVAEAAIAALRQLGDHRGLAVARRHLGVALQRLGRFADAVATLERALDDAEAAGDRATRRRVAGALAYSLCIGPTPVADALRRCDELVAANPGDLVLEAAVERHRCWLLAMAGRSAEALERLRANGEALDRLEHQTSQWTHGWAAAEARQLAGDHAGAEHDLIATWERYRSFDAHGVDLRAMNAAYLLAFLYCDRGRWDDAAACLAYGDEVPVACPTSAAVFRPAARARLAAHEGSFAEALTLAERAVECAKVGDNLNLRARAWTTLAEVHRAAGEHARAVSAVAEAVRLYEAKGNVAAATAARAAAA